VRALTLASALAPLRRTQTRECCSDAAAARCACSAICGGGRYDKLLSAYGGEDAPCAGFGFGDAVIIELLQEKNLLPATSLTSSGVQDVVAPLEEGLRAGAASVAAALRAQGRRVDLVLEPKKMKWVLKRAQSLEAQRLVLVGGEEWARGCVRVKELASREERDVPLAELTAPPA
jgi:histidyl-tRNA synthetase